jgi:flagellar assembly protein FliH
MATIIKKASPGAVSSVSTPRAVAFNLADMSGRAEEYLQTIRQQASKLIADAHQEAETIRRRAEEAGKKAAQNAIESMLAERVARKMDTLTPAIDSLVRQLDDTRGAWRQHWEHAAIQLAGAMARRILRRELIQQPEFALELVREGLQLMAGSASITVYLHPDDFANVGAQAERLAESLSKLAPARITADPGVAAGGCRLETQFGEVDLQIDSQVNRILEELCG